MTLVTPTVDEIKAATQKASLPKWLGTHHPLPYKTSDKAVMLVTYSRTRNIVGEIMPVKVIEGDGTITAYVDDRRRDGFAGVQIDGVIYDPQGDGLTGGQNPNSAHMVAAPYKDGWIHGRLAPGSTPENPRITVYGGVGVPAPIINDETVGGWEVNVPHVFRVENQSAAPNFTDNYTMLQAKMQARYHRNKERMVQTVLVREMREREYTDQIDVDEFPKFKHRNLYYASYNIDIVIPSLGSPLDIEKVAPKAKEFLSGGPLGNFNTLWDEGRSMSAKEAVFASSENQIVEPVFAGHPDEAYQIAEHRVMGLVKQNYGPHAGLARIEDIELYFAGAI